MRCAVNYPNMASYSPTLNHRRNGHRITGAMVIVRWVCRKAAQEGTWLHRMLRRKPRMLVAIALADKMARGKIIEVLRLLPSDPRSVARSRERRACEEVEER